MSYLKNEDVPSNCTTVSSDFKSRTAFVNGAAHFLAPSIEHARCWRCRAALLAEFIEASIRIAEELPPEAQAWFDDDLRLFGENAKRLDERSKQIAAAILSGRST